MVFIACNLSFSFSNFVVCLLARPMLFLHFNFLYMVNFQVSSLVPVTRANWVYLLRLGPLHESRVCCAWPVSRFWCWLVCVVVIWVILIDSLLFLLLAMRWSQIREAWFIGFCILVAFVGCSGSDNLDTFKTFFFIVFVRSYLGQFFPYDFFDALVF